MMNAKPERPKEEDCCGSGCNPCIFDVYEKKLQLWETKTLKSTVSVLNDLKYVDVEIGGVERLAPDVFMFTLQVIDEFSKPILLPIGLSMGDHVILKTSTVNGVSISRPYTPILNDTLRSGKLQIIIRLYENGEMSKILKELRVGDVLCCRGPYNNLKFKQTRQIILLGAGTGIIPLYNIAQEIVLNETLETIVNLVACFSDVESILLRKELKALRSYWNFYCKFYFSKCEEIQLMHNETGIFEKLSECKLLTELKATQTADVLVVICGPAHFNETCRNAAVSCSIDFESIIVL